MAAQDEARAEGQIPIHCGHVSLPIAAVWGMNRSWKALEPWLGFSGF